MPLELAAWPILANVFGFYLVGAGLLGKADIPTALKSGMIVGIVVVIQAFIAYALLGDFVTATVLGIAGMTWMVIGIAGFHKVDMASVAQLVLYVGIILLILGIYVMNLGGWVLGPTLVLGLAVFLLGVACWGAGPAVLGKIRAAAGGSIVLTVCAIDFILAFVLLLNLV